MRRCVPPPHSFHQWYCPVNVLCALCVAMCCALNQVFPSGQCIGGKWARAKYTYMLCRLHVFSERSIAGAQLPQAHPHVYRYRQSRVQISLRETYQEKRRREGKEDQNVRLVLSSRLATLCSSVLLGKVMVLQNSRDESGPTEFCGWLLGEVAVHACSLVRLILFTSLPTSSGLH